MEELETPPLNEVPGESAATPELSEATEAAENEGMVAAAPVADAAPGESSLLSPLPLADARGSDPSRDREGAVTGSDEASGTATAGSSEDVAIEAAESEGMVAAAPENDSAAAGGSDEASEAVSTESSEDVATEAAENEGMVASAPETGTPSIDDLFSEEPAAPLVEDAQLRAVLEAIIYVAEEPLTLAQLAAALHEPAGRIRGVLEQLASEFDKPEHGITVREVAGGYKMTTKPEHHEGVRSFVKSLKPPLKLSLPALETLAVIAYKQPVTGPEIMEIRGVQGSGVLKTLLDRKLIAQAGRKNVIGKPLLY